MFVSYQCDYLALINGDDEVLSTRFMGTKIPNGLLKNKLSKKPLITSFDRQMTAEMIATL